MSLLDCLVASAALALAALCFAWVLYGEGVDTYHPGPEDGLVFLDADSYLENQTGCCPCVKGER